VRSRPAVTNRPAPAAFQRPAPISRYRIPPAGVLHDEASSRIHSRSPVRPSPACDPRMGQESSGLSPGFAPHGCPQRTPRRGQSNAHWTRNYVTSISQSSFNELHSTHATSCRTSSLEHAHLLHRLSRPGTLGQGHAQDRGPRRPRVAGRHRRPASTPSGVRDRRRQDPRTRTGVLRRRGPGNHCRPHPTNPNPTWKPNYYPHPGPNTVTITSDQNRDAARQAPGGHAGEVSRLPGRHGRRTRPARGAPSLAPHPGLGRRTRPDRPRRDHTSTRTSREDQQPEHVTSRADPEAGL
jgi:hypothetical protein